MTLQEIDNHVRKVLKVKSIKKKSRRVDLIRARTVFCKVAIKHHKITEIAKYLKQDHSTVIASIKRYDDLVESEDETFRKTLRAFDGSFLDGEISLAEIKAMRKTLNDSQIFNIIVGIKE